ncbi:MAG: hypothetical protein RLZZ108_743 [Actinomycetota bacterium]|jgi:hypothetical protein
MASNSELEFMLKKGIEAQNRTTHAVRALGLFVLIQVPYTIFGLIILWFGYESLFWTFVSGLIMVVGTIHTLYRSGSELAMSRDIDVSKRVESSRVSSRTIVTPRTKEPSGFSKDLSDFEYRTWEERGKPDLTSWVEAGKPHFMTWLNRQQ